MSALRASTKFLPVLLLIFASQGAAASWWQDLLGGFSGGGDNDATGAEAKPGMLEQAAKVLGNDDITAALREALTQGTTAVVAQVSANNGFNNDELIHIKLPEQMAPVRNILGRIGMESMLDDLELRLNRAAEAAAPQAQALFINAISEMRIEDARAILDGAPDAATQYFHQRMAGPLADAMQPEVDAALQQAGAVRAYDSVLGEYAKLPFVPDVRADLTRHVVDGAIDGIFLYLGRQEAAIRENPQRWTSSTLQKVFESVQGSAAPAKS